MISSLILINFIYVFLDTRDICHQQRRFIFVYPTSPTYLKRVKMKIQKTICPLFDIYAKFGLPIKLPRHVMLKNNCSFTHERGNSGCME